MAFDFDWSAGALADGLQCYREQRFWHAHEHWEMVWLQLQGQEKLFVQALIQTTAAFHHFQRQNLVGTASLLQNALRKLDPLPPEFGGIGVDGLRQSLRAWLKALERSEPLERIPLPEICVTLTSSQQARRRERSAEAAPAVEDAERS
jgi:predicted metal-dependent hydrolase